MLLLIYPAIDVRRVQAIQAAAPGLQIMNITEQDQALKIIENADAFYGKITPELLSQAGKLRWIQSPTASLEHYLFPALIEHPALLTNMRGIFSDVIADHVMGYVLMLARNLHLYRDRQQSSRWAPVGDESAKTDFIVSPGIMTPVDKKHLHLSDCVMGIVGVGEIGREVARRASAFGMNILGVDPQPCSIRGILEKSWPVSKLTQLLGQSDFVVIAAPHTPETEQLFNREMLEQMKPESYLINIGRGAIVNLDDLVDALSRHKIAGAALDVFEQEPLPQSHPLWKMENVIITPHIAAASPRVSERHLELLCENVRRFSLGEDLLNRVDKQSWY